ncbi:UNVERIFIED_CONTAM: hypothetical protein GTU68_012605 [Idotea baltica]|nr:hypothetical protein [Idotea baltica]
MGRYPHKKVFQRLNKEDHRLADAALEELDIADLQNRQIGELSGGQQQRTFLARAMAQQADVLLLDEPFVGVDIPTEEKIIAVLRKLSEAGKTLLVVHHDLQAVPEYFDHVVLLNQRLIAYGPTEEVFTPEMLKQAFGGQLALLQQAGGLAK